MDTDQEPSTTPDAADKAAEHGTDVLKAYIPILSNWTLEYYKAMVFISGALLTGQLVLLGHLPSRLSTWIVFASAFTIICMMSALQTMLTTRNFLSLIVRDATKAAGRTEIDLDPFRTEKIKWLEQAHNKTRWRLFLNQTNAMILFCFGVVLTVIPLLLMAINSVAVQ